MKDHRAAALSYRQGDYAPRVLARGMGSTAEALCRIASRSGVPIVESADLAGALSSLEPFDDVPEEYWIAVAEILRFVYETRGEDELH